MLAGNILPAASPSFFMPPLLGAPFVIFSRVAVHSQEYLGLIVKIYVCQLHF